MGVQEELDELKQEKRNIKKQIQLVDGIIKEDLYTAYYAVSEKEEIVADREIEIPGMEDVAIEPETNVVVMNPDKSRYLQPREDTENLKGDGNSLEEK